MGKRENKQKFLFLLSTSLVFCTVIILTNPFWALSLETKPVCSSSASSLTDKQFEKKAKEYLGTPYRKGGVSKKGMDCSGFARTLYENIFGIDLPHSSREMYRYKKLRETSSRGMQPGDLVFFLGKNKKRINHVGVYLSIDRFIHASSSQGIMVSKLSDLYWKRRFAGSKRHMALSPETNIKQARQDSTRERPAGQKSRTTESASHELSS